MKRLMASWLLALVASSAAMAGKSDTDYNKSVDFTKYKTYGWLKHETGNELWDKRLLDAVDQGLAARGWTKAASVEEADAAVMATINLTTETSYNTMYTGMGGWGYSGWGVGYGMGSATTTASTWKIGTLLIDIFDAKSHDLLWRGRAEETASSKTAKNEQKLNSAVKKLFSKFPPPPAKEKK